MLKKRQSKCKIRNSMLYNKYINHCLANQNKLQAGYDMT